MVATSWSWAWWGSLFAVSLVNLASTAVYYVRYKKHDFGRDNEYATKMRVLAVPFVIVCAFRCFFPSIYAHRWVFFDTPFSSILAQRLLAFGAELCWVVQITMMVRKLSDGLYVQLGTHTCKHAIVRFISYFVVLLIFCAECFSTTATITTNDLFFFLEEGSWVVSSTLIVPCSYFLLYQYRQLISLGGDSRENKSIRENLPRSTHVCVYLLAFSITLYATWGWIKDVTKCYDNWQNQIANDHQDLDFKDGVVDAATGWIVTTDFTKWSGYLFWFTGYMSACVWSSILLMAAPRIPANLREQIQDQPLMASYAMFF